MPIVYTTLGRVVKSDCPASVESDACLPDCLADHAAPPAVVELFSRWVRQADATDSGRIEIRSRSEPNPTTGRPYAHATVDEAIRWLVKHRLVMRVAPGRGRGHHPIYFVRWSFAHPTLTQRARNDEARHARNARRYGPFTQKLGNGYQSRTQTGIASQRPYARERDLEERQRRTERSLKDTPRLPVTQTHAFRYVTAQLGQEIDRTFRRRGEQNRQLLRAAFAASIKRRFEDGSLQPGRQLGVITKRLRWAIADVDEDRADDLCGDAPPRHAYSWAGKLVAEALGGPSSATRTTLQRASAEARPVALVDHEAERRDLAAERIASDVARRTVAAEMGAETIADGLRAQDPGPRPKPQRAARWRSGSTSWTNTPTRRVAVGPVLVADLIGSFAADYGAAVTSEGAPC